MKKFIFLPLVLLIFLSSCSISKNGEDLVGFVLKMNELNESYNLSAEGFIYSEENSSIHKFFIVNESEILLSFCEDSKGRLTEMNIILSNDFQSDEAVFTFFKNSLSAFIMNDDIYSEIVENSGLSELLNSNSKETATIKSGNIELLLDVTTLGTVISVYKDI
ncbi:MAG: hypothetical protein E7557_08920 [Ruminococcaceae bacterium]|nr:hypothetical protein [Oscillospiraceae bacterium]